MEKFCVLIPKLNQPLCKSLSPVSILHGSKLMNLSFDDHSEHKFMMGKRPDLLKFIEKCNGHVTVSYQNGEIENISSPQPKHSSKQFEFCTDGSRTIQISNRGGGPCILDQLKTRRVTKPVVFKSKNISLGDIGTNLNFTG
jgi:hypothetical protein